MNIVIEILQDIIEDAKWNLENPGNEDDTLEQIIDQAERALREFSV